MTMGSAASAASGPGGSPAAGQGGGPNIPGSYTGQLTFDEWKKRKGLLPGQYLQRDAWEEWQAHSSVQGNLRPPGGGATLPVAAEPEPEEKEDVGSSPGFEKVQRFLRQQRATGRVVSPEQTRMAWQGYWDAWAGKQTEREKIAIERERLDIEDKRWEWQKGFQEEGRDWEREQAESSDAAAGGSMIGMGIGFAVGGPIGGMIGGSIGGMIGGSW